MGDAPSVAADVSSAAADVFSSAEDVGRAVVDVADDIGSTSDTSPPLGTLSVTIEGLPAGVSPQVTVSSPGYEVVLIRSTTLEDLVAGAYVVRPQIVTDAGSTHVGTVAQQEVAVTGGGSASVRVIYTEAGRIEATLTGLPEGAYGAFEVASDQYVVQWSGENSLHVPAGQYTIEASAVTAQHATFAPDPGRSGTTVVADADSRVAFAFSCTTVRAPDSGLHAFFASAVGKTDYTCEDLEALSDLPAYSAGIRRLDGIQYAKNLVSVNLNGNKLLDLAPLGALAKLRHLGFNFIDSSVTEMQALSQLKNLEHLAVMGVQISDLSPVAGLLRLTDFRFQGAPISDLTPLSGLTELRTLFLESEMIVDLGPLRGMSKLRTVQITNCSISDLQPLVDNTGLGADDRVFLERTCLKPDQPPNQDQIALLEGRGVAVHLTDNTRSDST